MNTKFPLSRSVNTGKTLFFFIILFSSLINCIEADSLRTTSFGDTLYVGGSGPGNYSTIQDAINHSAIGDTVFVYAHSSPYYERVTIPQAIRLIGQDRNTTIIDGQERGSIVTILSDNVEVIGFNIQNGGGENQGNGIGIHNYSNCVVTHTIIQNCNSGIYITNSTNNTLVNNTLSENVMGISLSSGSNDNRLLGNTILNDTTHGIYIGINLYQPTPQPDGNIVVGNTIIGNNDGIFLWCAQNSLIYQNTIEYSRTFDGISIEKSENNTIAENSIMKNRRAGVYFDHVDGPFINNVVIRNTLAGNLESGVHIDSYISDIIVYQNNFFNNGRNGYDNWSNQWDNGTSTGNYWDDYKGVDANGDGIGDTPYNIPGGTNHDRFPLMKPYGDLPLYVDLTSIKDGYLYVCNHEIVPMNYFLPNPAPTIIIGKITIEVKAIDNTPIDHVAFYIDGKLKHTCRAPPYSWTWRINPFVQHTISVTGVNTLGETAGDKISVWKFL
jgi:nitrous oxidase accessory protein